MPRPRFVRYDRVMSRPASVLDRILDPLADGLTSDAARGIIALRPDPHVQARIDELAAKASVGELTSEERAEYEEAVEAIDVLGLLKAKARTALARRTA